MNQLPEEVKEQYRLASIITQVVGIELQSHRNGLLHSALELLNQDIKKSELTVDADAYMVRANAYAAALSKNGYYRMARILYEQMVQFVEDFRGDDPKADEWRHLGAVYINLGIIEALVGDLDRAVPNFIRTQADDQRTYGREGPLIEEFYEERIRKPCLDGIYNVCAATYDGVMTQPLGHDLLRELSFFLGEWEYTLIAATGSLSRNSEENNRTPNLYSKLQILHGLSNLCLLFEVTVKRIAELNNEPTIQARYQGRRPRFTLKAALDVLYDGVGGWWNRVDNSWQSTSFDQTQPGVADFDTKLNQQLNIQVASEDDLRVKSIFIAALVRNFLGHELDVNSSITQAHYQECLKFTLLATILIYQQAQSQGQV